MGGKLTEAPAAGSKWRGITIATASADPRHDLFRVMGAVENYVVARRTGCAPFLTTIRDWHREFIPATPPPSTDKGGRDNG